MKEILQRANQFLFFTVLLVVVLFFGRSFLIPIFFAALLAMLMAPVCRRLEKWGFNRALASAVCVLILILFLAGMGLIIGAQFSTFAENITQIEQKGKQLLDQAQTYIQEQFGVSPEKQESLVKEQTAAQPGGSTLAKRIVGSIVSTLTGIVLTLVFTFLMVFNKEHFEQFFLKMFHDEEPAKVKKVVREIADVSQHYLTGRATSMAIIAVLYSIGLLIVGLKNAILLACIAALLTIIPYVGTVLGGLIPVLMAVVTEDSLQPALLTAIVLVVIQTIDNYFIEPNVVGGEVNLGALWSILSLIAGGMIWGPAGMILFLPLVAILKIVCDHIESLRPIGFLIGEPGGKKPSRIKVWIQEKIKSFRSDRKKSGNKRL